MWVGVTGINPFPSEKGGITIKVFYSFVFMMYIYNENRKAVGRPDMSFILSEVLHFNLINSINKRTSLLVHFADGFIKFMY